MRKSQRNNSKLSRFVYYKHSGLIVFVPIIILSIVGYLYIDSEQEFFTAWSCETIRDYVNNVDVPERFPIYDELTGEQSLKINNIIKECNDNTKFSERIMP